MAIKRASAQTKSGDVFGHRRKRSGMFRVGLYARVSTQDQQTSPLQLRTMREYAAARGWKIVQQVKESAPALQIVRSDSNCWMLRGAVKSTLCLYGVWIGGGGHCRI